MTDPWVHRLSDYIDDELPAEDRAEIEEHLARCEDCSKTLADLRGIVEEAHGLEDHYPPRDLWDGIAAHIGAETVPSVEEFEAEAEVETGTVISIESRAHRPVFSFGVGQLLAACLALMMVSGGVGYFLRDTSPQQAVMPATEVAQSTTTDPVVTDTMGATTSRAALSDRLASIEKQIGELQRTFDAYGTSLDSEVYAALEDNLFFLDQAIGDWREALAADPQSEVLTAHLAESMMRKVRLLEQANQIATTEI